MRAGHHPTKGRSPISRLRVESSQGPVEPSPPQPSAERPSATQARFPCREATASNSGVLYTRPQQYQDTKPHTLTTPPKVSYPVEEEDFSTRHSDSKRAALY